MTSINMEPDEKILRNSANHHTDNVIPQPHHSHHHHHHHHHHHKSHHHHYHNNGHYHHRSPHNHHNHQNHHNKHPTKANVLKTVDVDEFFEHSLPENVDVEKKDSSQLEDETSYRKIPIPVPTLKFSDSVSLGLSKSLPSSIPSSKNEVISLTNQMGVWKDIEEEEKYPLTHLMIDDRNESKGVRTQRRTVSMNEDIVQQNFRTPLEELHHVKPFKGNSLAKTNQLPKLIIPKAMPARPRRLSKSTCKSPESPLSSKEDELVKTIDKYISCCNSNYEEVEKQINTTFSTLSLALNHRRKTLIEEAKQIRDRKVKSLKEKKEKLTIDNISCSNTVNNITKLASNGDMECVTPVNEMQPHQLEEKNAIHEPWNNSTTISVLQNPPTSEQDDSSATTSSGNYNKSRNGIDIGRESYQSCSYYESPREKQEVVILSNGHFRNSNWSSSGYGTSSPTELNGSASNAFDSNHQNLFSITEIEDGNVTFSYNNGTDMEFISNIGRLKEDLSAPRFTIIKGLTDSDGIVGDKVEFQVHTNDREGKPNCNNADKITIRIYDRNRNKVQVEEESNPSNVLRHSSFNEDLEQSAESNVYHYSFVPLKPGKHEIAVKLNEIHISNSPSNFLAYPRLNLTFTSASQSFEENEDRHFPISRNRSGMSEGSKTDEDEEVDEEEEDECHPHSMNVSDSWVIQNNGKSSLLQSLCNHPSDIYAQEPVSGMCGWQIRITTACMHIKLNIGVKTRSGIPDLDEQFTCDFHLESFAETASSLDRANHVEHHAHHKREKRKGSIFTRLSWTFTLLMNDGVLRVTCHELDQDKTVEVNLKGAFPLRPYCSMIHHHNEDHIPYICPRPQLTFL